MIVKIIRWLNMLFDDVQNDLLEEADIMLLGFQPTRLLTTMG